MNQDYLNRRIKRIKDNIKRNLPKDRLLLSTGEGHAYFDSVSGVTFSSVTTKLKILSNPIFSDRKMNRSLDYLQSHFSEIRQDNLSQMFDDAKKCPETLFKEASALGTRVHDYVEHIINIWIEFGEMPDVKAILKDEPDRRVWSAVRSFDKWVKDNNFTPISSELQVWSDSNNIAGTLDCIGLTGSDLTLVDWKTSAVIIKSYYLQVAAYYRMFTERTGLKIKKVVIVGLDLDHGIYHDEVVTNIKECFQAFKHCSILHDKLIRIETELNKRKNLLII